MNKLKTAILTAALTAANILGIGVNAVEASPDGNYSRGIGLYSGHVQIVRVNGPSVISLGTKCSVEVTVFNPQGQAVDTVTAIVTAPDLARYAQRQWGGTTGCANLAPGEYGVGLFTYANGFYIENPGHETAWESIMRRYLP